MVEEENADARSSGKRLRWSRRNGEVVEEETLMLVAAGKAELDEEKTLRWSRRKCWRSRETGTLRRWRRKTLGWSRKRGVNAAVLCCFSYSSEGEHARERAEVDERDKSGTRPREVIGG